MTLHPRASRRHRFVALAFAVSAWLSGCATTPADPPGESPPIVPALSVPLPPAPVAEAASASSAAPSAPTAAAADAEPSSAAAAPIDPLRPEVRIDLDDRSARIDLWQRIRDGFKVPDLDGGRVRQSEQWYATRPDYIQRMTERGGRYLFHIVEEVDKRGLPTELALLPFIESAFNPEAMSSARASGMWQFMPATGRGFDLKQNVFRDDRRDVLASTRAALDYLTKLHGMFGDWHLALAAYNWGEGNVRSAIRRNQAAGRPADYASLRMPEETRQYVPKLQAVKNIVLRPGEFSLSLPVLENHPYFLSVPIERDIDVAIAARLSGMQSDSFKQLNPQLNMPVILAAGTPQLLLPYDNANQFVKSLARHHGPLASWTAWTAPRTLTPADAARQVGMSEAALREVNAIPPRMVVKAGSTLLVHRAAHREADVPENLADHATIALAPDGPAIKRLSFKAGKNGESVSAVAKRYMVSADQVAQWNKVNTGATFQAGATVVVFVATKAARSAGAANSTPGQRATKASQGSRPAKASAARSSRRSR